MNIKLLIETILTGALLLLSLSVSGAERKSPRDLMIVGRDYNLFEEISNHPLSFGIGSWRNEELGNKLMGYGSIAFLTYKDVIRLEAGGCGTWNHVKDRLEINMLTGVSTLINDHLVVGLWMAPFWGMVDDYPDDPWGIMVGYAF